MPKFLPSELPEQIRIRHHWIVMFRRPSLWLGVTLLLLLVLAITDPWPMLLVLLGMVAVIGTWRWYTWDAEWIILTRRRLIRVQGVPETTKAEASLLLDRISGAVLKQTPLGKLLDYASINIEAAGNHPDFSRLIKIEHPHEFYEALRDLIFAVPERPGGHSAADDTGEPIGEPTEDDYPTTKYAAYPDWS